MRDDGRSAISLRELDTVQRLSQCSDLIDLDQVRVSYAQVDPFLQKLRVGYKQIVADELHFAADLIGEKFPTGPVVFRHAVFNRDDWVLLTPTFPIRNHLFTGQFSFVTLFENVFLA